MTTNFQLRFTNIDAAPRDFDSLGAAICFGRRAGFEFSVWSQGKLVAIQRTFGGLTIEPVCLDTESFVTESTDNVVCDAGERACQ